MIIRKDNWPEILMEEIDRARKRPFKFGLHDCCMFTARTFKTYTGVDLARKLRGYKTAAGATRMLKKKGKGTLLRTMEGVMKDHGCPKVKPALLRRGDVCMAKVEIASDLQRQPRGGKIEWAVGICVGSHAAFASDGVVFIPMSDVKRGWRCG